MVPPDAAAHASLAVTPEIARVAPADTVSDAGTATDRSLEPGMLLVLGLVLGSLPVLVLVVVLPPLVLVVVVPLPVLVEPVAALEPPGTTSTNSGSAPKLTWILLALLALAIADVPVTGS